MKINSNNIRIKIQITIKLKAYFCNDMIGQSNEIKHKKNQIQNSKSLVW